jgi:hypothetical protein
MDIAAVAEIGGLVVAAGTLIFAAGRSSENIKANTKATENLSTMLDGHLTWSAQTAHDHDKRIDKAQATADAAHTRIDDLKEA